MLPGCHLANLLRVHYVVPLFAALSEDPAKLLHATDNTVSHTTLSAQIYCVQQAISQMCLQVLALAMTTQACIGRLSLRQLLSHLAQPATQSYLLCLAGWRHIVAHSTVRTAQRVMGRLPVALMLCLHSTR